MNPKSPKMVHHLGPRHLQGLPKSLQLNLMMIQHHRPNRGREGSWAALEALGVAAGRLGASLMKQNLAKNDPTSWWQVVLRALQNPSKIHVTMIPNRCKNAPKTKSGGGPGGSWKPLGVARDALRRPGGALGPFGSAWSAVWCALGSSLGGLKQH